MDKNKRIIVGVIVMACAMFAGAVFYKTFTQPAVNPEESTNAIATPESRKDVVGPVPAKSRNGDLPSATLHVEPLVKSETPKKVVPQIEGQAQGTPIPARSGRVQKFSLATRSVPELWLSFQGVQPGTPSPSEQPRHDVRLPREAKKLLREHWRVACAYYYAESSGSKRREERMAHMRGLINANVVLLSKLEQVEIAAPGGRRVISENEAVSIVKLLNNYARDLFLPSRGRDNACI